MYLRIQINPRRNVNPQTTCPSLTLCMHLYFLGEPDFHERDEKT